jgi:hypothetical protein
MCPPSVPEENGVFHVIGSKQATVTPSKVHLVMGLSTAQKGSGQKGTFARLANNRETIVSKEPIAYNQRPMLTIAGGAMGLDVPGRSVIHSRAMMLKMKDTRDHVSFF